MKNLKIFFGIVLSFVLIALAVIAVKPLNVYAAENNERRAGVLLHITSLPSKFGIGDLGKEAFEFVDYLKSEGQTIWQVLPLNPVGYGHSPYQSPSAFAGTPMIISPEDLVERGLLTESDIQLSGSSFNYSKVEYERAWKFKSAMLKKAFQNFKAKLSKDKKLKADFENFCKKESYWLEDYALFIAIKGKNNDFHWGKWDDKIKSRDEATLKKLRKSLADDVLYTKFEQYIFDVQWQKLRNYANENGIQIIGDIPIFVSADSADVWANPELFQLKPNGYPAKVAGVPPDTFSKTGQFWGNPQYNWDAMKAQDYKWWKLRFKKTFELFDIVRIDHFRGFEAYWEIDGDAENAINGRWVKCPGNDLFDAVKKEFGNNLQVVAEDLGVITAEVQALRQYCGFPGMNVFQTIISDDVLNLMPESDDPSMKRIQAKISFDENGQAKFNFEKDSVTYTGTHDNNTAIGWYTDDLNDDMKLTVAKIFNANPNDPKDVCQKMIEAAYASDSNLTVIPMQDILKLDSRGKMNTPNTVGNHNWSWRLEPNYRSRVERGMLKALCDKYSR